MTPDEQEAETQRLYQASLESHTRGEAAYLLALTESTAANNRSAAASERIAFALDNGVVLLERIVAFIERAEKDSRQ